MKTAKGSGEVMQERDRKERSRDREGEEQETQMGV